MPDGFFSLSVLTQKTPAPLLPRCGQCQLYKHCKSPKMPVSGKGKRKVLIIGEAPGKDEDDQNKQFVGKTGQYLQKVLRKLGIDMRTDCWLTNAAICRPKNNQLPERAIDHCRPNLTKTLKELDPEVIIPLGAAAVKSLIALIWKEQIGGSLKWAGFQIPSRHPNAWICPTFHPSYCARQEDPVVDMYFERHLKEAFEKERRPWDKISDDSSRIECILDPQQAAKRIREMSNSPIVAWDYEANMLKPDSDKFHVVCCSMSNGKETIAYPWQREAIEATLKFVRSDVPKIASNMKYEDRVTRKIFKGVRGWYWDTMLASHWLDNRPGITSIKFQAYVRLGVPPWNLHVEPYLKAKGSNLKNRIKDVDLQQLLVYCGLDSLYEFQVAMLQMEEAKYPIPN